MSLHVYRFTCLLRRGIRKASRRSTGPYAADQATPLIWASLCSALSFLHKDQWCYTSPRGAHNVQYIAISPCFPGSLLIPRAFLPIMLPCLCSVNTQGSFQFLTFVHHTWFTEVIHFIYIGTHPPRLISNFLSFSKFRLMPHEAMSPSSDTPQHLPWFIITFCLNQLKCVRFLLWTPAMYLPCIYSWSKKLLFSHLLGSLLHLREKHIYQRSQEVVMNAFIICLKLWIYFLWLFT